MRTFGPIALVDAAPGELPMTDLPAELAEVIQFSSCHIRLPLDIAFDDEANLYFASIHSGEVAAALRDCGDSDLFCASLGSAAADLVAERPALLPAAEVAMERWIAYLYQQLNEAVGEAGLYTRPPLYPGVLPGFGLDYVRAMLSLTNAGQLLGVYSDNEGHIQPAYCRVGLTGISDRPAKED